MSGPLLVVAHEGYRNGATKVLVAVLPDLVAHLGCRVRVEVRTEGPLAGTLRRMSTDSDAAAPGGVLVNGALAAGALWDHPPEVGSLVWVHEEGEALRALPERDRAALCDRADVVAAVSTRGVADLEALGVPPSRLHLVPPAIDASPPTPEAVVAARAALGVAGDEPLVVGCGEATWRKGADLFIDLARRLGPDITCAWVGRRTRAFARQLDHDTALAGVSEHLRWVGELDDAMPTLGAADLFVLTSRIDPQPLVPMEAAVAGTATAGFAGTGLDDLAARGGADTVPYPDLGALADRACELLGDPGARRAAAAVARQVAVDERSSGAVVARLLPLLDGTLHRDGAG